MTEPLIICGSGRIGGALRQCVNTNNKSYVGGRIDPQAGLSLDSGEFFACIDLLIICISARHKKGDSSGGWHWQEIYNGLAGQVARGELTIRNSVMISSTRVYEAYNSGLISASSPVKANSDQGLGLIEAEKQLRNMSQHCLLLRCSGLYGALYPKYTPVLQAGLQKPRFGVRSEHVVERIWQAVQDSQREAFQGGVELLTDGYVYFNGDRLSVTDGQSKINEISQTYRILLNSRSELSIRLA